MEGLAIAKFKMFDMLFSLTLILILIENPNEKKYRGNNLVAKIIDIFSLC